MTDYQTETVYAIMLSTKRVLRWTGNLLCWVPRSHKCWTKFRFTTGFFSRFWKMRIILTFFQGALQKKNTVPLAAYINFKAWTAGDMCRAANRLNIWIYASLSVVLSSHWIPHLQQLIRHQCFVMTSCSTSRFGGYASHLFHAGTSWVFSF